MISTVSPSSRPSAAMVMRDSRARPRPLSSGLAFATCSFRPSCFSSGMGTPQFDRYDKDRNGRNARYAPNVTPHAKNEGGEKSEWVFSTKKGQSRRTGRGREQERRPGRQEGNGT